MGSSATPHPCQCRPSPPYCSRQGSREEATQAGGRGGGSTGRLPRGRAICSGDKTSAAAARRCRAEGSSGTGASEFCSCIAGVARVDTSMSIYLQAAAAAAANAAAKVAQSQAISSAVGELTSPWAHSLLMVLTGYGVLHVRASTAPPPPLFLCLPPCSRSTRSRAA
jgi:hypothetical protein